MNMAILGAGNIARQMAVAVNGLQSQVRAYAVASRSLEKAEAFAREWHFQKAYGSYEELAADPEVDLVYIATPHAMHYDNARLCVEQGKAVLVEKAFTANAAQARELIRLAEEKKVFLTEAIWTRYMPGRQIVESLLAQGVIGEPISLEAEFSVPLSHKQRMYDPALAGGALLDLGMYCLTFASMYFGDEIAEVTSRAEKLDTGVDAMDDIYYTYVDGKKAHLRTSMITGPVNRGEIKGTQGRIEVDTLNNFTAIRVYDNAGNLLQEPEIPAQINGYEYEVLACVRAMEAENLECEEMPHSETIEIMEQMDRLRREWGVAYPFEVE
ncbi:MAG: Gfo/Idh/MocA family oxidoreductase [Lachnospiraceae bacterium]|nr:Gfo/Idh/MocA family oxidoreductase [Lachnospiraceae bacterium]